YALATATSNLRASGSSAERAGRGRAGASRHARAAGGRRRRSRVTRSFLRDKKGDAARAGTRTPRADPPYGNEGPRPRTRRNPSDTAGRLRGFGPGRWVRGPVPAGEPLDALDVEVAGGVVERQVDPVRGVAGDGVDAEPQDVPRAVGDLDPLAVPAFQDQH